MFTKEERVLVNTDKTMMLPLKISMTHARGRLLHSLCSHSEPASQLVERMFKFLKAKTENFIFHVSGCDGQLAPLVQGYSANHCMWD
ncbi:hypothetical protein NPIL_193161 [Nephila pilipes]|uniref:Uncharacterized protein n=1 Tax=Nephila pilipes TaxID=299642 RepID=A0A8X6NE68_NEPPI|nr:hypothetical protein NPIL_193161 [Nephila pilipes]